MPISRGFEDWVRGLIGAAISGSANALSAGIAIPALDPSGDFAFFSPLWWKAVITLGGIAGFVSMSKFLAVTPLPPATVTEVQQVKTSPGGTKTETSVKITEESTHGPPDAA